MISQANASPDLRSGHFANYLGPEYKQGYFEDATIADFHLLMTADDAIKILSENGWRGGWLENNTPEPETIETFGHAFRRGADTTISLYRYKTSDTKETKIYAIEYTQKFDRIQDIDILAQKIMDKYGDPTNITREGMYTVFLYSQDNKMMNMKDCASAYKQNQPKCFLYTTWLKSPKLTAKISPKSIELTLENEGEALLHQEIINARKGSFIEHQRKEESENLEMGF
ncbi:MAG: hypothetical protein KDJ50_09845 [Alphaproteobacteria bacterium]|nr:hypothetical protein [Alphaproteobacteria bacterium]